ncbi:MAG TPA: pantoate--beta-alanine ligase, partial [Verrucomicrobiales bacterium]|nr:pantoate--beta-alanine ligase [Verrucomicrobiales bacterium]
TKKLAKLDYIAFFDPVTLQPLDKVCKGSHMALAVYFGKTRLIDNIRL